MATRVGEQTKIPIEPVVTVKEMDHIAMRVKDVDASLRFYHKILGLPTERLDEFRDGKVPFPSVRINADTIIDFFGSDQEPIGKEGIKNQDHFCMVIEPTDMEELKTKLEAMGVGIQAGPGKRWGSHGDGISLYIYDPDDNVVELRHY